jgi:hypothetical protein
MIAFAAVAIVASTRAQDNRLARDPRGADPFSADSAPATAPAQGPKVEYGGPGSDTVHPRLPSSPFLRPAARAVGNEEAVLERRVDVLSQQLEAADSDERRGEIKAQLGDILGRQFDLRQKRHALEIEGLEARIRKLRQLVQKRQENRAEIISHRLDQIVRDSQGLGF